MLSSMPYSFLGGFQDTPMMTSSFYRPALPRQQSGRCTMMQLKLRAPFIQ